MNMFDIQREIFTAVATKVLTSYPDCRVTNAFEYSPAKFPCVAIVMSDDGTNYSMRDSSGTDNFHDITLTVDVYSNSANGKKTEAEAISEIIKDKLYSLNFEMNSCRPISNLNMASIYRITATFTATVGADGTIYTRR